MKSAFELAMERLEASDPNASKKLTAEQKAQLAEIDQRFKAKIAEREIFLQKQLTDAHTQRDTVAITQIEKQLQSERTRLQTDCETEKDRVRNG